jgi:hypothetical protein
MRALILFSLTAQILLVGIVYAQHAETETAGPHKNEHTTHWNHIAVFDGATSKFEKEGTHFTLGLDYIRKFPPSGRWAISIFGEAIFEEHTEWLIGIPLFYRLYDNLWVRTGPGIEILQEEEHDHGETKTEIKVEFLWRVGIGYDFEFGKYSIAPSIDVDFGRSTTAVVWGLNFGYGF